jgi:hypothetical protein
MQLSGRGRVGFLFVPPWADNPDQDREMKFLLLLVGWGLLLVLCWPLAILLILLAPLIWLVLLPFRLAAGAVNGLLAFIRALFLLPARLLGYKG